MFSGAALQRLRDERLDGRRHALLSHCPPERCFSPVLRSFIAVFFRSDEDDDTVKDAEVGGATIPIVKETEEKTLCVSDGHFITTVV